MIKGYVFPSAELKTDLVEALCAAGIGPRLTARMLNMLPSQVMFYRAKRNLPKQRRLSLDEELAQLAPDLQERIRSYRALDAMVPRRKRYSAPQARA